MQYQEKSIFCQNRKIKNYQNDAFFAQNLQRLSKNFRLILS